MPEKDKNSSPFVHMTAGAVAGMIADLSTHPLSTVKTRLQVQGALSGAENAVLYRGPVSALFSIIKAEGVMSLYKGVGIVVAGAAPSQALYFGGYEAMRSVCGDHPVTNFGAGMFAQICGSLAWVPMDVVKERLQIEGQVKTSQNYGGSYAAFRNIIATEGVKGLYRAYWMHQATWAPFNGLYFSVYEYLKNIRARSLGVDPSSPKKSVDTVGNLMCGLAAGTFASVATSPIDLVKTRLQVQASNPAVFDYNGPVDALLKILKREGALALFDGVAARIIWLTPRLSIAVSLYEVCSAYLKKQIANRSV